MPGHVSYFLLYPRPFLLSNFFISFLQFAAHKADESYAKSPRPTGGLSSCVPLLEKGLTFPMYLDNMIANMAYTSVFAQKTEQKEEFL